ncbi:MAG: VWA domain-containing protein [Sphingomonadaceae bacterium]
MTTRISLAAGFDRSLFWHRGGSCRHLVVRVSATGPDRAPVFDVAPLNIALAIDASGSMSGAKLDAAKRAALGLIDRLTSQDRLTLVSFASDVIVHQDAVKAGPELHARIAAEIGALETRGMTNLSDGWFAAVECAAAVADRDVDREADRDADRDRAMTPRVIVLSDGRANEGITDRAALARHADELRRRGVLTSTLGIGDDYDEMLLSGMAEAGGGRFHDAEHAEEIESVLLGELSEIHGGLVDRVEIGIAPPPGFQLVSLGRTGRQESDGRLVCQIGSLHAGSDRIAVFRVFCPDAEPGEEGSFAVTAEGIAAITGERLVTGPEIARLTAAGSEANRAQPRDEALAADVAKVWLAHVVAEAAALNRRGAHLEAARMVERELRHFERYVADLPGGVRMVEELRLLSRRAERELSPRLSKEMMLRSRLAVEGRSDHRGTTKEDWAERIRRGE